MAFLPPSLRDGGTIGIVSPSRAANPEWVVAAQLFFESHGYRVFVHPQNHLKMGRLAGTDMQRAAAVMDVFQDPDIDAVLCARGGCGSLQILDLLDYDVIRSNSKPIVGFSDATALLHAIHAQAGFVTFHGPVARNLGVAHDVRTEHDLLAGLRQVRDPFVFAESQTLRGGMIEAVLTGGNLTMLECLVGTPFDWSAQDGILFIEDICEEFYAVDRTLTHLRLAGKFKGVRAVLVGDMVDVKDDPCDPYGRTLQDIILSHFPDDIPFAFSVPCGHGAYLTTLPLGARVRVVLDSRGVELALIS